MSKPSSLRVGILFDTPYPNWVHEQHQEEMVRVIHSLTPLQSCVLRVLAKRGPDYAPFEAATIEAYRQVLRSIRGDDDAKVDVPSVQQALIALQEKALVWRAARGVYTLEEASLGDLMAAEGMLDLA